jgi:hypothetical protein
MSGRTEQACEYLNDRDYTLATAHSVRNEVHVEFPAYGHLMTEETHHLRELGFVVAALSMNKELDGSGGEIIFQLKSGIDETTSE